jgi:hypothetical protein
LYETKVAQLNSRLIERREEIKKQVLVDLAELDKLKKEKKDAYDAYDMTFNTSIHFVQRLHFVCLNRF